MQNSNRDEIIELRHNGDPFGGGFVGLQTLDGGATWYYLGGEGAQSRAWWRRYARRMGYRLREAR